MRARPLILLSAAVLAAGCDSPSGDSAAGPASHMEILSGAGQSGTVGEMLGAALVVRVTDAQGRPVHRQRVEFAPSGGGSVQPTSVLTNADGRAGTWWTLGTSIADSQRVEARVGQDGAGTPPGPAVFRARAEGGAAARLEGGGETEAGTAGTQVPGVREARVVDRYGNPVAGAEVAWTVTAGGGTVEPARSVSDEAGVARATWTRGALLGTPHVLTATLADAQARWTTVAQPDFALTLTGRWTTCSWCWVDPDEWQGGLPGKPLPYPVPVSVSRTAGGAAVAGVWVRVTRLGGGAQADSALTDGLGVAWLKPVLGPQTGEQEFSAHVLGTNTDLRIHAFSYPETPVLVASISPVPVGLPYSTRTVSVGVNNAAGARIPGYPVKVTALTGSAIMSPPTRSSASHSWIMGGPGLQRITVTAGFARIEVTGMAQYAYIVSNLTPNARLTPRTPLAVYSSEGPTPTGPGNRDHGPLTFVKVTVNGRSSTQFRGGGSPFDGGYVWSLHDDSWLNGAPEGPAVAVFEINRSGIVMRQEVPVIVASAP